jgi:hypothetical protein
MRNDNSISFIFFENLIDTDGQFLPDRDSYILASYGGNLFACNICNFMNLGNCGQ